MCQDNHIILKGLFRSRIYQESADILSKLALSGGGAVVVLNDLVVERCAHADSATREVGVEVLSLSEVDTCRGVTVPIQQVVDVVLVAVSRQIYYI